MDAAETGDGDSADDGCAAGDDGSSYRIGDSEVMMQKETIVGCWKQSRGGNEVQTDIGNCEHGRGNDTKVLTTMKW